MNSSYNKIARQKQRRKEQKIKKEQEEQEAKKKSDEQRERKRINQKNYRARLKAKAKEEGLSNMERQPPIPPSTPNGVNFTNSGSEESAAAPPFTPSSRHNLPVVFGSPGLRLSKEQFEIAKSARKDRYEDRKDRNKVKLKEAEALAELYKHSREKSKYQHELALKDRDLQIAREQREHEKDQAREQREHEKDQAREQYAHARFMADAQQDRDDRLFDARLTFAQMGIADPPLPEESEDSEGQSAWHPFHEGITPQPKENAEDMEMSPDTSGNSHNLFTRAAAGVANSSGVGDANAPTVAPTGNLFNFGGTEVRSLPTGNAPKSGVGTATTAGASVPSYGFASASDTTNNPFLKGNGSGAASQGGTFGNNTAPSGGLFSRAPAPSVPPSNFVFGSGTPAKPNPGFQFNPNNGGK